MCENNEKFLSPAPQDRLITQAQAEKYVVRAPMELKAGTSAICTIKTFEKESRVLNHEDPDLSH